MPPLPPVAGVVKVRLVWAPGSLAARGDSFYVSYSGGPPLTADMVALAGSISGSVATDLCPLLNVDWSLSEVVCTDLSSPSGATAVNTTVHAGTRTGAAPPSSVCTVIDHLIARRYRGGKPRIYPPFGVIGDLATIEAWSATFANTVSTNYGTFMAAVLATGGMTITLQNQVSVSYYHGFTVITNPSTGRARNKPTLRATPVVDQVTGRVCTLRVGTQRRRLRG